MTSNRWEVPAKDLRVHFEAQCFPFTTTEELPRLDRAIGQERAVRAMEFGLHIPGQAYHIFVAGLPGSGRKSIVTAMVKQVAQGQPTPHDWCYVYNFRDPHAPRALSLPAGRGRELQRDMEQLVAALRSDLGQLFQSADYQEQRRALEVRLAKGRSYLLKKLRQRAKNHGYCVTSSRAGLFETPFLKARPAGAEPMAAGRSPASGTPPRHRHRLDQAIGAFFQQLHTLQEEVQQQLTQLDRRVASYAIEPRFARLREKYRECPGVLDYLRAVQADVLDNLADFLAAPPAADEAPEGEWEAWQRTAWRYAVNVLVDHGQTQGAPLVEEPNPTYGNLVGRIGREAYWGAVYTDFTLIRAGALLRANGGYLLLDAEDILREPLAWEALKRALQRQELKIEEVSDGGGAATPVGLAPEPIPLQVRVVLFGSPSLYGWLQVHDEDFRELFKVKVDFDVEQDRTEDSPVQYGRFIAQLCRDEGLPHFEREAVAAVLEQACRWTSHQRKLSLQFGELADLIRQASHWARREGEAYVRRRHVRTAIAEQIYRSGLLQERLRQLIAEGTLVVGVAGSVVGQINGLSLYDLGDFTFGLPSRITARVFLGEAGIVNIEREVDLSEETHSKGVLILAGYLGGRYARDIPLSLSATLCFEQSYAEVEGDSASAAELVALLSALSELPIDQGIALTGSVDQLGRLQAISGVNEKIEGFYAVCKTLGLTGTQGVILPQQNRQHLMLSEEVVEAVAAGHFHIYAVSTVDEAMEILMGRPAGELQPNGSYPPGSINAAVMSRLYTMSARLHPAEPWRAHHEPLARRPPPLP
jgi:lon-related putative ATP-dependent protease